MPQQKLNTIFIIPFLVSPNIKFNSSNFFRVYQDTKEQSRGYHFRWSVWPLQAEGMRAHVDRGFEGLWLKSDHLHSSWWDPSLEQATRGLQGSCSSQSIPTEVSMLIQAKAEVPPRCLRVMAAASTLSSGQPCKHKYKQSTTGCGMTQDRADHMVTLLWPCRVDNGWF